MERLSAEGVDYVVCGGVACVLHGCQRTTLDLDLNISLTEENLLRAIRAFKTLGLSPRVPVPLESLVDPLQRQDWIQTKGAMVFTVQSPDGLLQIDLFLVYLIPFEDLKRDAVTVVVSDWKISVSSIHHLIQAKEAIEPKRPKDLFDLAELRNKR